MNKAQTVLSKIKIAPNPSFTKNNILQGFTFQELIDVIYDETATYNRKVVAKAFKKLLKDKNKEAERILNQNMDKILAELGR